MIVSRQNPRVKLAASLHRRKYRAREGLLLVEGQRLLQEALSFGAVVEFVLLDQALDDPDWAEALARRGIDVFTVSTDVMRRVATTESSPGVVGVARPRTDVPDVRGMARVLVLDRLQDPGNVGTAVRTAAAVGVDCVLLTKGAADPTGPKAMRASAGAYFALPVHSGYEPQTLGKLCREAGFTLVAADVGGTVDAFSFDWEQRHALVIGSEAHGIDPRVGVDSRVALPMPGGVQSLNAAMAATVLMYEAWRVRTESDRRG